MRFSRQGTYETIPTSPLTPSLATVTVSTMQTIAILSLTSTAFLAGVVFTCVVIKSHCRRTVKQLREMEKAFGQNFDTAGADGIGVACEVVARRFGIE